MTLDEAKQILGSNRPRWELRNIVKALSLHSWLNTEEDKLRLAAAKELLKCRRST